MMAESPVTRRPRLVTRPVHRRGDMFEAAVIAAIVVAALYFGRVILMPLAVAIVLAFVLTPIVLRLRKLGLPDKIAVACSTLVALAVLAGIVMLMSRQIVSFAEDLPRYQYTLINKIRSLRDFGGPNDAMSRAADTLKSLQREIEGPAAAASPKPQTPRQPEPVPVKIDSTVPPLEQLRVTLQFVVEPLTTVGFIIVFVVVLLLYRDDVRDRVIRLTGVQDLERTRRTMDDAGQRLNRYFLTTTVINTAFGIVIGAGLWAIGIPNPLLWGVLAMMCRFIPFAGVPIAAILPVMLALVVDPGWSMVATTIGLFVVAEVLAGQAIEPVVQGEATGISPLALILAAAFWASLWGPLGLFLAVPVTAILAVVGRHLDGMSFLDVLLGTEPALLPADRLYQRLLSGDAEAAAEHVEVAAGETSLGEVCDDVVMVALNRAVADARIGKLDGDRQDEVRNTAVEMLGLMREFDIAATGASIAGAEAGADSPAVVCLSARAGLADVFADLLVQVLQEKAITAVVASTADAVRPSTSAPQIFCVCGFAADQHAAHLKFLVRRLRRALPDVWIVAVVWGLDGEMSDAMPIKSIGFDDIANTLRTARDRCALRLAGARSTDDGAGDSEAPVVSATT